jgi:hypothetical protein
LSAAAALGPAVTAIETIVAVEYVKVHCSAAGSLPAGDVKVRFRGVPTPEGVALDDNIRAPTCAKAGLMTNAETTRTLSACSELLHFTRFLLLGRTLTTNRAHP